MKLQLMGGVCKTHPSGSSLITSTHLAQHPHHYTHNGKDNKGETAPTATYIDIVSPGVLERSEDQDCVRSCRVY